MAGQIDFNEVEKFASLFAGGEVPRFPQSVADLPNNLTARETIRAQMPELWTRLHGGAENQLPADVLLRMHRNELTPADAGALRGVGMEAAALAVEAKAAQQAMQQMEERMAAEREAREAAREVQRANAEMSRLESIQLGQMQLKAESGAY